MAALLTQVVVALDGDFSPERIDLQRPASMTTHLRSGLVSGIDLIDPLLQQGAEDLASRLNQ